MLKKILLVVIAALLVLLIYAAFKPKQVTIQRSVTINSKPEKVFVLINDLKAFNTWNPFAKDDPDNAMTYETLSQGKGAAYRWTGKKSGEGRMEISDSVPGQQVALNLDFSKPFEAHNKILFTLAPVGGGTQVTWAMSGDMPYLNRLMTVFFNMDTMVGGEFEKGLASLKDLAEKRP